ncbi:hypothetical protein EV12_2590 [Prochlorococcus sp. MIT 0701]|nr:hypothetical protein EV12_2590 [Prochlorococcus sp. MIT 0701]
MRLLRKAFGRNGQIYSSRPQDCMPYSVDCHTRSRMIFSNLNCPASGDMLKKKI